MFEKIDGKATPKINPMASAKSVLKTYKIMLTPQFCLQLIIKTPFKNYML